VCVCVSVALVIQHAKRMRHIMWSSVTCVAVQYFSTWSHKRHHIRKKSLNIKCVFWFSLQLLSNTFLVLRRSERDIIINVHRSSCKVTVILVGFKWTLKCRYRVLKNTQISNFMKIRPMGAEFFYADSQTDRQTWRSSQSLLATLQRRLKTYGCFLTLISKNMRILANYCRNSYFRYISKCYWVLNFIIIDKRCKDDITES
jgi:hypothetical protein